MKSRYRGSIFPMKSAFSAMADGMEWRCVSMMPGIIVLPPKSIRWVFGPASRVTAALVPTSRILSPRIAMACRVLKSLSTVRIFPFVMMVSGYSTSSVGAVVMPAVCAAASPAVTTKARPVSVTTFTADRIHQNEAIDHLPSLLTDHRKRNTSV